MKRYASIMATAGLVLGLAACSSYDEGNNAAYAEGDNAEAYGEGNSAGADYSRNGATTAGNWPAGSRIVVQNGVTYRIEPGGARVALGPNDSRIVVENGVSYRVDPGGTRVRIDDEGAVIGVDEDGVSANVNLGGNTSVQVNSN